MDADAGLDVAFKPQAPLVKERLKRQHRLGDEAAEVKCLAAGPGRYVVNPRKLQQILRQSSHPRGHGEDVPVSLSRVAASEASSPRSWALLSMTVRAS